VVALSLHRQNTVPSRGYTLTFSTSRHFVWTDQAPGVVAFISAKDVPGENRVKGGASDAPLFAEDRVEYVGQHIGIVVAETPQQAQKAAALVAVRYGHPKVPRLSISPCQILSCWMLGMASTTHGQPFCSLLHRGRTVGGRGFCQGIVAHNRAARGAAIVYGRTIQSTGALQTSPGSGRMRA
jgi:hypothetical protein